MEFDTAKWRAVPGYFALYVSEDGAVHSTRDGVRHLSPRMHKGYWHVNARPDGYHERVPTPVHKLVLLAFHGDKPYPKAQCRHLDGDPLNNHRSNLRWGTSKENAEDSRRHGTLAALRRGDKHNCCKVRDAEVVTIRRLYGEGLTQERIAQAFGITQRHVSDIVRGESRCPIGG